ncbi:zinc finger protein 335 [Biomphalaria pfeifferi]|uniref:Zinc finger protein 335 n=1 Tax=Biomphalaria pfeifferi TaxID=112525 RepID=A0AAD8BYM4_BIOPF|nr:zinc finger protein 335 [Biomphalaria pfeifferi]
MTAMHTMNSYRDYLLSLQNANWYNHPGYSNISVPQWNFLRPYDSTAYTNGYTDQHNQQKMYTVSQNVKYNEPFPTKGYQPSFTEPNQKFHPSYRAHNTMFSETPFSALESAQTSQFLKEKTLGGNADSGSPFVYSRHESNTTTMCVINTALNLTKKTPMKPSAVVPARGPTRTKQNKKTQTKNTKSNKKPPNFLDIPSAKTSKTKRKKTNCDQDLIVPPVNTLTNYERNHFFVKNHFNDKPVDLSVDITRLHCKSTSDSVFHTCGTNLNSTSVDKNTEFFKSTIQCMKLPIVLPTEASQETSQNSLYDTPSPSWHSHESSPENTHNPSDHENATSAERETTSKLNIYWTSNKKPENPGSLSELTPCQKVQSYLNEPFGSHSTLLSLLNRNSLTPAESNELTPVRDVHNAYTKPYISHPNETITIDLGGNFQTSVHVKKSLPPSCNSTKDSTEPVQFHPRLSSTPTSDSPRPNQSTQSTSWIVTAKHWKVPEKCVTSYWNKGPITSHKEATNRNGAHFNPISSSVNNTLFESTKVDDCFTTEFEMHLKNKYEHFYKGFTPSKTAVTTPSIDIHVTAQSAAALHTPTTVSRSTTSGSLIIPGSTTMSRQICIPGPTSMSEGTAVSVPAVSGLKVAPKPTLLTVPTYVSGGSAAPRAGNAPREKAPSTASLGSTFLEPRSVQRLTPLEGHTHSAWLATLQKDYNTTRPITSQTDNTVQRETVSNTVLERPLPECSIDSLASNPMLQKRKRHRETRYSCNSCSYTVRKLFNFRLHIAQHCPDTEKLVPVKAQSLKLRCGICAYFATSAKVLRKHVEKHAFEKRFLCGYCRQDFRSHTEAHDHVTEIHKRKVVFCDRKKLYEAMTRRPQLEISLKPYVVLDSKEVDEYLNLSR